MKSQTSFLYQDYPIKPYISETRDIAHWEKYPDQYPHGKVSLANMTILTEGILPGDILMLRQVNFGVFTTKSPLPSYFEYKYGIERTDSLQRLIALGYIRLETPLEALALITPPNLKKICRKYHLSFKGKREELLKRISENLTIEQIEAEINFKTYMITEAGKEILIKYDEIIKKHLAEL